MLENDEATTHYYTVPSKMNCLWKLRSAFAFLSVHIFDRHTKHRKDRTVKFGLLM